MSAFAHQLRAIISEGYQQSQARFAEAAGMSQATISRLVREEVIPSAETICVMAKHLPAEIAGRACAAWLQDNIPNELRYQIRIQNHDAAEQERIRQTPPRVWMQLDGETQGALMHIARLAVRHKAVRDSLISTAKFLQDTQP
jgi:transcriptional regulator with XRE-family HTH domain